VSAEPRIVGIAAAAAVVVVSALLLLLLLLLLAVWSLSMVEESGGSWNGVE